MTVKMSVYLKIINTHGIIKHDCVLITQSVGKVSSRLYLQF